jgi:hypothetical protein
MTVIARHRVGAARRPMTGSSGRSSIPEPSVIGPKGRGVLDTRLRGHDSYCGDAQHIVP